MKTETWENIIFAILTLCVIALMFFIAFSAGAGVVDIEDSYDIEALRKVVERGKLAEARLEEIASEIYQPTKE
jgi:hypothetical protein